KRSRRSRTGDWQLCINRGTELETTDHRPPTTEGKDAGTRGGGDGAKATTDHGPATEVPPELGAGGLNPQSAIRNPHSDEWLPIGGSSIRETERHLARILRMEYETFLNSAYFQQGRADEFTRQKPDARK